MLSRILDLDSISVPTVCNLKAMKTASYINYMCFDGKNCVKSVSMREPGRR